MSSASRSLRAPLLALLMIVAVGARAKEAKRKGGATSVPTTVALGKNVLRNPGGEEEAKDATVPGWQRVDAATWEADDAFEAQPWGKVAGEWDYGLVGAPHGGERYLRIAFEHGKQRAVVQTIDVAPLAKTIDDGKVGIELAAALGGFVGGDSTIQLGATMLDANGKELGTVETPQVDFAKLSKPDKGAASLTHEAASGAVPVGTRKIVARLRATATGASNSYLGLADNLSLVLVGR